MEQGTRVNPEPRQRSRGAVSGGAQNSNGGQFLCVRTWPARGARAATQWVRAELRMGKAARRVWQQRGARVQCEPRRPASEHRRVQLSVRGGASARGRACVGGGGALVSGGLGVGPRSSSAWRRARWWRARPGGIRLAGSASRAPQRVQPRRGGQRRGGRAAGDAGGRGRTGPHGVGARTSCSATGSADRNEALW